MDRKKLEDLNEYLRDSIEQTQRYMVEALGSRSTFPALAESPLVVVITPYSYVIESGDGNVKSETKFSIEEE